MRRALIAVTAAACLAACTGSAGPRPAPSVDPVAYVDPLIGTSGPVHDSPAVDTPFGMIQWGPDTTSRPYGGGYEYRDRRVTGFSLGHVDGTGCAVAGDAPILPVDGSVPNRPESATLPLDHRREVAALDHYQLTAGDVTTELAVTPRAGLGRFTAPAGHRLTLEVKLADGATPVRATQVHFVSSRQIAFAVRSGQACGSTNDYTLHADVRFDRSIVASGVWTPGHLRAVGSGSVSGARGAYVTFGAAAGHRTVVEAQVGISYVSGAGASGNRAAELRTWDASVVAARARAAWRRVLGRVQVDGGGRSTLQTFYTAMFHALRYPATTSDVDRRYIGADQRVHVAPAGHTEYTDVSGWDTYRSQTQLVALVAPTVASDQARSMLDFYDQSGQLPKWTLNNDETYVMVGDPADAILADTYAFGARGFDAHAALAAMVAQATRPNDIRPGQPLRAVLGYLPLDGRYGCCRFTAPVSTQLEYDVDDHAIAELASALGERSVARRFAATANDWVNSLDVGAGYLQTRTANGLFPTSFDPTSGYGFIDGTSALYTTLVPFDLAGAIAAGGGTTAWRSRLDALMSSIGDGGAAQADFGDEPTAGLPWEYDFVGEPYRTQQVTREIEQRVYHDAPLSMPGNDDLGSISAWYVFAALGVYPETPGSALLAVGSPLFARATIHLGDGRTLHIVGHGAAPDAPYVQAMTVDGHAWQRPYLDPSLLRDGGTIVFDLGTRPDRSWGAAADDAPPSDTTGLPPAIGWAARTTVIARPAGRVTLDLRARALLAGSHPLTCDAVPGDVALGRGHVVLTPSIGRDAATTLTATAPAAAGSHLLTLTCSADGVTAPRVVVDVRVG